MELTTKEKKRVEAITKKIIEILPYAFLVIASLIFVLAYGSNNDILMKVIKIILLALCIYSGSTLIIKVIDLIKLIKKK